MTPQALLGMADIVARWVYSKQGVHKLARRPDFPAPWGVFNLGRTKLWRLEDVESYETLHPEVRDESFKRQKMIGYYLATLRGKDSPTSTALKQ
jgi:hypothetical protein